MDRPLHRPARRHVRYGRPHALDLPVNGRPPSRPSSHGPPGRSEAALGHIEAAHRHAETYGEHYISAEIHRLHAEVLYMQGIPAPEIEGHLRAALEIARAQAARLWELRAANSLARLWHAHGRGTEAHGLLAPIYASFPEGFDPPDLVEARSLLSQ